MTFALNSFIWLGVLASCRGNVENQVVNCQEHEEDTILKLII